MNEANRKHTMSEKMTDAEIEARIAELTAANNAATSWGAAVGARSEEIKELESELRARRALDVGGEAALLKRMSDALLKVRPFGGSELFIRHGEAFYADPDYCGRLIDEMRQELHEARKKLARHNDSNLAAAPKPEGK